MRTAMGSIRLILVLGMGSGGTLWAQTPDEPPSLALYAGARARFVTTESPGVVQKGTLLHGDDATLTLLTVDGREVSLPLSSLAQLELALEKKDRRWAGALLGAAAGAGVGAAEPVDPQDCGDSSSTFCSRGEAVVYVALFGALVGALVGSKIHSDRWTRISIGDARPAAPPARGGLGLASFAVTVRF